MASSSSSPMANILGHPVSEKLTRENYLLWKAQILPAVRGAQLMGYLDGSSKVPEEYIKEKKADSTEVLTPHPAYATWVAQDQQLLGYINSSLSKEVLAQVVTATTAAEAWKAIQEMCASQSRARVIHLRQKLATTRKGEMSAAVYFTKMRGFTDEMAAAGKKLDDDDIVSYILTGLDSEYNGFVENVSSKDTISLSDLFAKLLSAEARIEAQKAAEYQSSANAASRGGGRGNYRGRGTRGRDGGRGDGGCGAYRGRGNRGGGAGSSSSKTVICQLCDKVGHTGLRCWKRFDHDYHGEEKSANTAAAAYGVDTNWYTDTGATDHITGELDKLTTREKYHGHEQVHAANGSGSGHEVGPSAL